MNFLSRIEIEKLEERLLKVVMGEYPGGNELYLNIDKVDIVYIEGDPTTTIHINFGRYDPEGNPDDRWQKETEIPFVVDNLDFIAGQFFQAIMEKGL